MTNTVTVRNVTSRETSNDSITPGRSAVTTLLAKATTKHVKATTMVMYHLNILLQFLGFSGSSRLKVTNFQSPDLPSADMSGLGTWPAAVSLVYSPKFALSFSSRRGKSTGPSGPAPSVTETVRLEALLGDSLDACILSSRNRTNEFELFVLERVPIP